MACRHGRCEILVHSIYRGSLWSLFYTGGRYSIQGVVRDNVHSNPNSNPNSAPTPNSMQVDRDNVEKSLRKKLERLGVGIGVGLEVRG